MIRLTLITFSIAMASVITSCQKETDLNQVPIADAGDSRTVQLPKDTIMLNGTGSDLDGTIAGYLWSKISGPNTPVIHNNGSESAFIDGFVAGKYVFQFMVIDNLGAIGIDSVEITVTPSPIMNLSLRPANNPTEMYITGVGNRDFSSGAFTEIGVFSWTNSDAYHLRTAIKFDFSNIPSNATIVSAKLSLYSHPNPNNGNHISPNYGDDNSMLIQKITAPWAVGTTFWYNQPSSTTANQTEVPKTDLPSQDLIDIDVKGLVSSMLGSSNYGFLIKLKTEQVYNSRLFCSSFYQDPAKHPKLDIVYELNQ